jgi:uncharacterized protein YaaW (UPF0174 family)
MRKVKNEPIRDELVSYLSDNEINKISDDHFGYACREIKGDNLKCKDIDNRVKLLAMDIQKAFIEKNRNYFT